MSEFAYMFPEIKRSKIVPFDLSTQANKILEESNELLESEYYWSLAQYDGAQKSMLMECFDVIHACETFIRMLCTPEEAKRIRDLVIEKNEKRGYYAED